jgi:hypothetical protein
MSVKVSDLIKTYEDQSTGDITEWIEKLELVAKLQKIDDLNSFLPLFLGGSAFAVFNQLSEEVKGDYDKLKAELLRAFGANHFQAYELLVRRTYRSGETVDVYVSDLKRLVSLIGQKDSEPLLRCAFVAGLPTDIAMQLKSIVAVEKLGLADLVTRARMILSSSDEASCAVGQVKPSGVICYNCSGIGHYAKQCTKPRKVDGATRRPVTCYKCKQPGHIARNCLQGNENGSALAPDVLPSQ